MTRNEYIAETAARFYATLEFVSFEAAIKAAINMADELERLRVAPWQNNYQATSFCHKCGQPHALYIECPQSSKGV